MCQLDGLLGTLVYVFNRGGRLGRLLSNGAGHDASGTKGITDEVRIEANAVGTVLSKETGGLPPEDRPT